jgi:membrane-associated phospholipid phosphatase
MKTPTPTARLLPVVLLGLPACSNGGGGSDAPPPPPGPALTSEFDASVAVQWEELLYTRIKVTGMNPPRAARSFAYAGVALYESVLPGMPDHVTLQGQLHGLAAGDLPSAQTGVRYHWPTVANRALAIVANGMVPASSAQFDALERSLLAEYEQSEAPDVIDRSIAYGELMADALLTWAAADGIAGVDACGAAYVPPPAHDEPSEGAWTQVTGTTPPLLPCWGSLRTFVVADGLECAPVGPPAFSTDSASAWYAQAQQVYTTTGDAGVNLTADQNASAFFWADSAGATGTPAGHWIAITSEVCTNEALKLDAAAEAFARVGLAVADAFVTCWRTKYDYYLQRPATYIRDHIDTSWDPLLATPNFPSYSSDHATQSAAAATVLTAMFGAYAFTDTTHTRLNPALHFPDRSFSSFQEAAAEAAASRLFSGIHYAFDDDDGLDSGACVGTIHATALQFLAAP